MTKKVAEFSSKFEAKGKICDKFLNNFYLCFLALPLAFVGIPIYLNIADFYAKKFSISLTIIGFSLAFVRFLDILMDPIIGNFSDKIIAKKTSRINIIKTSSLFLAIAFYLIFSPPIFLNNLFAILWFVVFLSLTYLFFNVIFINFESLIAANSDSNQGLIKLNSIKELMGLVGMILAFLIPTILFNFFSTDSSQSYVILALTFGFLIFLAVFIFLTKFEKISLNNSEKEISAEASTNFLSSEKISFLAIFSDKKFIFFLAIFLLNSIAVSLPAANLNFFVSDVLKAGDKIGYFLSLYFLSAVFFMMMWKNLFNKFGIINIWILSIFASLITFIFAYFLNENSSNLFYLVCVFSGAFLGADLIATPAIIGSIANQNKKLTSSYFSYYNLIAKFGLMIAASSSLIILGFFDYQPGKPQDSDLDKIRFFYAILPCFIKLIVIKLLLKFKNYENSNN
jgi:Na+/melibiose symporter-like transporter